MINFFPSVFSREVSPRSVCGPPLPDPNQPGGDLLQGCYGCDEECTAYCRENCGTTSQSNPGAGSEDCNDCTGGCLDIASLMGLK